MLDNETYGAHYSVLNNEAVDHLLSEIDDTKKNYILDLTFGRGGHTFSILNKNKNISIIAFDQDIEAITFGQKAAKEQGFESRIVFYQKNFSQIDEILKDSNLCIAGAIMDLGVSSHQFDSAERGFSFRYEAPLDMRMNTSSDLTAADIVNTYTQEELEKIFFEYGEEKFSRRISQKIIEKRNEKKITTTKDLEDIIFHCYPSKMRYSKTHPATRCFQGLRIAVNDELNVLEKTIPKVFAQLSSKGKLVIISFHSLEDRIVKNSFKKLAMNPDSFAQLITKKPLTPSPQEIIDNPRSRSAKMRVILKR